MFVVKMERGDHALHWWESREQSEDTKVWIGIVYKVPEEEGIESRTYMKGLALNGALGCYNCHKLHDLNNRNIFPYSLEAGSVKSRCQQVFFWQEPTAGL